MNGAEAAKHAVRHGLRDAHHKHSQAREEIFEKVRLELVLPHDINKWENAKHRHHSQFAAGEVSGRISIRSNPISDNLEIRPIL